MDDKVRNDEARTYVLEVTVLDARDNAPLPSFAELRAEFGGQPPLPPLCAASQPEPASFTT